MTDLDLSDVRTFVAIAQAGTLTAAAKEMQLPASTVSRALTRLEKDVGVLLVQRSPRGLSMTDSGREYLQSCRCALRTLKEGCELLEGRRSSTSGLIEVVCPVTMARDVLAPLLKEFLGRYPAPRVEIEACAAGWDQAIRENNASAYEFLTPERSLSPTAVGGLASRWESPRLSSATIRHDAWTVRAS
jgi:LysR family transcriptional activator of dmlA